MVNESISDNSLVTSTESSSGRIEALPYKKITHIMVSSVVKLDQ